MRVLKSQSVVGVRNLAQSKGDIENHAAGHAFSEDIRLMQDSSPELASDTELLAAPSDKKSDSELMLSRQLDECESKLRDSEDLVARLSRENESLRSLYELESGKAFEEQKATGYEHGLEEGRTSGKNETREIRGALSKILEKFENEFQVSVINQKSMLLELVFSSITKIIGEKYRDNRFIVDIVNKNISALRLRDEIRVTVCPADYKILSDYLLADEGDASKRDFRLSSSSVVECGGCIIETEAGGLDARLDIQLNELRKIFLSLHDE